jgi:hypothetical protein
MSYRPECPPCPCYLSYRQQQFLNALEKLPRERYYKRRVFGWGRLGGTGIYELVVTGHLVTGYCWATDRPFVTFSDQARRELIRRRLQDVFST